MRSPHALGLLQAVSAVGNVIGSLVGFVLLPMTISLGLEAIGIQEFAGWRLMFVAGVVPAFMVVLVMRFVERADDLGGSQAQGPGCRGAEPVGQAGEFPRVVGRSPLALCDDHRRHARLGRADRTVGRRLLVAGIDARARPPGSFPGHAGSIHVDRHGPARRRRLFGNPGFYLDHGADRPSRRFRALLSTRAGLNRFGVRVHDRSLADSGG